MPYESQFDSLREIVSPELARLPDRQLAEALAARNIDAEAMEGFFDDFGKFAARAAPAILPIAGQVVGGIYGGPAGAAIGGQLGSLAGGAISQAARSASGRWSSTAPCRASGGSGSTDCTRCRTSDDGGVPQRLHRRPWILRHRWILVQAHPPPVSCSRPSRGPKPSRRWRRWHWAHPAEPIFRWEMPRCPSARSAISLESSPGKPRRSTPSRRRAPRAPSLNTCAAPQAKRVAIRPWRKTAPVRCTNS